MAKSPLLPTLCAAALLGLPAVLLAQGGPNEVGVFVSGSDGSDDAFEPTESMVFLVDKPVYHFTSITIPQDVTITFAKTANNYPVVWLAQGDVVIDGVVNANGGDNQASSGGMGGPGGWNGGDGGQDNFSNPDITLRPQPGQGPGGALAPNGDNQYGSGAGHATGGENGSRGGAAGRVYGNSFGIPLLGGSGGSGGTRWIGTEHHGGGGGGGGGAIRIASSTTITVNGDITVRGGSTNDSPGYDGGAGSGGTIILQANFLNLGPEAVLDTLGGGNADGSSGFGGNGRVRLEAYNRAVSPTASVRPNAFSGPPLPFTVPADFPGLRIVSVGGQDVTDATGEPGNPDIMLSSAVEVQVQLEASNIPLGVQPTLLLLPTDAPEVIVQGTPLEGSFALSTSTASVVFPPGVTQMIATVNFAPALRTTTEEGETVAQVEVRTDSAGAQSVEWITEDGERVAAGR